MNIKIVCLAVLFRKPCLPARHLAGALDEPKDDGGRFFTDAGMKTMKSDDEMKEGLGGLCPRAIRT